MKALIVDDEYLACEGMLSRLKRMGFTQITEIFCASSGQEGMELVSADTDESWLVITDICMPDMDGLKMIKKMRAVLLSVHFIVFSAHRDFDYAKEAIKLGVIDYLLKPCRYDELKDTVEKILKDMEGRHRQEQKAQERLRELAECKEPEELAGSVKNILSKLQMSEYECYSVIKVYPRRAQIKCWREVYPMLKLEEECAYLVNHPKDLKLTGAVTVSADGWAGVSTSGRIEDISRLLQEAGKALSRRILVRTGSVLPAEEAKIRTKREEQYKNITKRLNADLLRQGREAIREELAKIFSEKTLGELDGEAIKKLFVMAKGILHSMESELRTVCDLADRDFSEFENLREIRAYFLEGFGALSDRLGGDEEEAVVVQWAREYVLRNLDQDINMAVIANQFNMNYYYFSRLYSKITGETFTRYILKARMEAASGMLKDGMSIPEVARKTGYVQVKNFTRAFHRYYGMPPSEWLKHQATDR